MNFLCKLKFLIAKLKLKSIKDKDKRRKIKNKYKNLLEQKFLSKSLLRNKFGVSYSVFDGEELLEPSIRSIRNNVDYINVVYQDKSWTGESENKNIYNLLISLKEKGLIDEIIKFKPNYKKSPNKSEIKKRNLGLKYAKKNKCDYFLAIDTDEFYDSDKFNKAKVLILKNNITHSYCNIVNYGFKPNQRYLDYSYYSVPFFSKIKKFKKLKYNPKSISLADPTRQMEHYLESKYYFLCDLQMHHMSYVRNDLISKLKNSSNGKVRSTTIADIEKENVFIETDDRFFINKYLKF